MSLDLYVISLDNGVRGEISDYDSLEIERNYYSVSKMVLRVPKTMENADLLRKGNLLALTNNPTYPYIIEHFGSIKEGRKEIIEVYAYSLNYLLSFRTVPTQTVLRGHVEDVVKELIRINAINPSDPNRVIPLLSLEDNLFSGINTIISKTGSNLLEHSFDILKEFEFSLDLIVDYQAGSTNVSNIKVMTWRGNDRSINQSTLPRVMFSQDFDNILSQNYYNSDLDLKTVAYVAGEGEGVNRAIQQVNNASGLFRREQYVDARDLQRTYFDENGDQQTLVEDDYLSSLTNRGLENLSNRLTVESFEATVDDVQYRLGTDYGLGDLVTFQDSELGVTLNVRVTSIKTISNKEGVTHTPSFGTGIPNKLLE